MEVAVVAVGVEVGDAVGELDGREEATALLGADLLAGRREGDDGRRRVGGNRSRATTGSGCEY